MRILQEFKPVQCCSEKCKDAAWADQNTYYHKTPSGQMIPPYNVFVTESVEAATEKRPNKDEMIYFVPVSIPHLYDIRVWGPFHTLRAINVRVREELRACREGQYRQ